MADLTVSAAIDSLLGSADAAAARVVLELGGLSTITPAAGVADALTAPPNSTGGTVIIGTGNELPALVATNLTGTASGLTAGNATLAAGLSGAQTISVAASASTPAMIYTGAAYTGGTGTTAFPSLFMQPTGATAATTWSTAGTFYGANAATGFAGNFIDLKLAGASTSAMKVSSVGGVTLGSGLTLGTIFTSTIGATSGNDLYLDAPSGRSVVITANATSQTLITASNSAITLSKATTCSSTLAVTGASTLGTLTLSPAASATPATNGQLTFEATSNTSLTVKLKGSDGTVRSVVLTLAP